MDATKKIRQFINPNWVPTLVLIILFPLTIIGLLMLLFFVLPTMSTAKKTVKKLEAAGKLNQAAAELTSPSAKHYMNGKLILTDNFIFCKGTGCIYTYDELRWVYRHKFTQRFFLIPIKVTESLYAATKTDKRALPIVSMGKDKMDTITNAIVEIYKHNPNCLIGYTDQNVAAFKQK